MQKYGSKALRRVRRSHSGIIEYTEDDTMCPIVSSQFRAYSGHMTIVISIIVGFIAAIGALFYYDSKGASLTQTSPETETNTSPSSAIPALTEVDRSGQGLTKLPSDILTMTNLQQLDLSNNALTGALPAEVRHLQDLEVLNISNNKMTGLPAELGQLSKLRILNVSNNQLTGIPHELGNLQQLEVLDLSGNDVSEQDLQIIRDRLPSSTQIVL